MLKSLLEEESDLVVFMFREDRRFVSVDDIWFTVGCRAKPGQPRGPAELRAPPFLRARTPEWEQSSRVAPVAVQLVCWRGF